METSSKRLENNIVEVTVTVSAADVDKAIAAAYKDAANKYRFDGFRPGRAPRKVIDRALGAEFCLAQATEAIVADAEPKAMDANDIVALGNPSYPQPAMVEAGKDFTFVVNFTVRPELTLSSYEPVAITLPSGEATEAEIDAQIERVRDYFGSYEDITDGAIAEGSYCYLKCVGIDNADSLNFDNRLYKLGAGAMPADFDAALMGLKAGDSAQATFTIGEGDDVVVVVVNVTVNRVVEHVLPEVTDEFAKQYFAFDDVAAMRAGIATDISNQKKDALPQIKENKVTAELAKRLEGEATMPYIQTIVQDLGQNLMNSLQSRGLTLDAWLAANGLDMNTFMGDLNRQATDIANESLALDALVREQGLTCSEEELENEFKNSGAADWEQIMADFKNDGRLPAVRVSVARNKAIEWLLNTVEVTISDEPEAPAAEAEAPAAEAEEAPKPKRARKSTKKAAEAEAPAEGEAPAAEAEEAPKPKRARKSTKKAAEAEVEAPAAE